MAVQLPGCSECGASIRTRADESCPYCGTLLPWELWDELCRTKVEVVRLDHRSLGERLRALETSVEFVRLRRKVDRQGERRRRRMDGARARRADTEVAAASVLGVGLVAVQLWRSGATPWILGLPFAVAWAALATVRHRASRRRDGRRARRRRRRPRATQVLSAVVLEVGPARHHDGSGPSPTRRVVLGTARDEEHVAIADARFDVAPGTLGIALMDGLRVMAFHDRGRLEGA